MEKAETAETKEPNQHLATTLRALRNQQGWSLDRTAQETGVSKAMLGQIERGESSPTIATLWKIATGFRTSLSSFLYPLPIGGDPGVVYRAPRADRVRHGGDGMVVESVFPYDPYYGFELFELTLQPAYERLSEAHELGVCEHVIVLGGQMDVLVEGEWIALAEGDALRFAADRPHGYRNPGAEPALFHNLICYTRPGSPVEASAHGKA